jgi:hypothetical protein
MGAMGGWGKFGYVLWATAADLVMRHGPLLRMKPYSKICDDFCAVGQSTGFGYAQWATAQDFVMHFILGHNEGFFLCAMTDSTGFCYAPWAIDPKLITIAQNCTN